MPQEPEQTWDGTGTAALDTRQLECFVAVATELHVGRAAARLHMTQPPLTRRISRLESDIGARLFRRTPTGMALTRAGTVLLERANRILGMMNQAVEETRMTGSGSCGLLSFGYDDEAIFGRLPALLHDFAAANPGVSIRLRRMSSAEQLEGLLDQALDVAVGHHAKLSEGLTAQRIQRQRTVLAVPAHAEPERQPIRLHDLATRSVVSYPSGRHLLRLVSPARDGHRNGSTFQETEARDIAECLAYVAIGVGVALVPESVSRMPVDGVEFVALLNGPEDVLTCVWRDEPTAVLAAFRDFMRGQDLDPSQQASA